MVRDAFRTETFGSAPWLAGGHMKLRVLFTVLVAVSLVTIAADAQEWVEYRSVDYGFSMKVPTGTRLVEKEGRDGWGFLYVMHEGVELFAWAKLGTYATPEEIERFANRVTGTADRQWKLITQGTNQNGWRWFRTAEASDGRTLILCDYGTGPKGSYLLLLKTTEEDYAKHKADYQTWYESIRLF
jgi:hypothetical protein